MTQEIVSELTASINDVTAELANQDPEVSLGSLIVYGGVLNDQTAESDVDTLRNVRHSNTVSRKATEKNFRRTQRGNIIHAYVCRCCVFAVACVTDRHTDRHQTADTGDV